MTGIELKESKEELEFVKDRFYDFPEETGVSNDIAKIENAINAINELEKYYTIGSVDECREAREKQIPKKAITYKDTNCADCPVCGATVRGIKEPFGDWCSKCGQKLDWSD